MNREKDFHLIDPTWCLGCGIYGIFSALKKASAQLDLDPEQMVTVTGIGCHGRLNNYFKSYGFHALHGRTLPVATGVKLSNPRLQVVGVSGDGDAYSIGLGHLIHSIRRNINVTYLVADNRLYALTQGQTSPTSQMGFVSVSTPEGSKELPLNGLQLALASGGTFIARGFSGDPTQLASLIEKAMNHEGFALIEVLSPCVTQNKIITYEWFRSNIYGVDEDTSFNPSDKRQAWERLANKDKIPVGLIYVEKKPSYEALVLPDRKKPLVFNDLEVGELRLKKIMDKFQ
ncbi:MAG: 2-oxoacid:ferredoxin oxidoreductase subunit beta [Candidatus Aminicenantes bacterium]|nr:MAG: 2-oxoacid:ferredoxin oxidoreductase subunit beta [Candidatus Aminicenantes bacterium]